MRERGFLDLNCIDCRELALSLSFKPVINKILFHDLDGHLTSYQRYIIREGTIFRQQTPCFARAAEIHNDLHMV